MFRDGIGIAAGLIDDQHARGGTSLDIDGVETRAVAGDDQQVGRADQQITVDVKMFRQFVARRTDLIGVRRTQDRRGNFLGAIILEPIQPHIGAGLENVGIDLVGQIFDVENTLVVDGHWCCDFQFGNP